MPLLSPSLLHQILVKMEEEEAHNKRNEVAILIDHVLVLILSRLIAHPLCSCKRVCCSWNSLILGSEYCKELPQILTEFFYHN